MRKSLWGRGIKIFQKIRESRKVPTHLVLCGDGRAIICDPQMTQIIFNHEGHEETRRFLLFNHEGHEETRRFLLFNHEGHEGARRFSNDFFIFSLIFVMLRDLRGKTC
jgi:hypothetical protein